MSDEHKYDSTDFILGIFFIFGLFIPGMIFIWAWTIKEVISIFR